MNIVHARNRNVLAHCLRGVGDFTLVGDDGKQCWPGSLSFVHGMALSSVLLIYRRDTPLVSNCPGSACYVALALEATKASYSRRGELVIVNSYVSAG